VRCFLVWLLQMVPDPKGWELHWYGMWALGQANAAFNTTTEPYYLILAENSKICICWDLCYGSNATQPMEAEGHTHRKGVATHTTNWGKAVQFMRITTRVLQSALFSYFLPSFLWAVSTHSMAAAFRVVRQQPAGTDRNTKRQWNVNCQGLIAMIVAKSIKKRPSI
jgi:hypothetical protein